MKKFLVALFALGLIVSIPKVSIADRPTDFYTTVTKTDSQTTQQTATTLWTPASGFSIVLQGVTISTDTLQNVKVQTGTTNVIPPQYMLASTSVTISGGNTPIWQGAANGTLTYTSSASGKVSIVAWGYEEII